MLVILVVFHEFWMFVMSWRYPSWIRHCRDFSLWSKLSETWKYPYCFYVEVYSRWYPFEKWKNPLWLQVMDKVLESTPFAFSVEFAAIAARRDFLNLEKWLQDNLTIHRDSFFQVQNLVVIDGIIKQHFWCSCVDYLLASKAAKQVHLKVASIIASFSLLLVWSFLKTHSYGLMHELPSDPQNFRRDHHFQ